MAILYPLPNPKHTTAPSTIGLPEDVILPVLERLFESLNLSVKGYSDSASFSIKAASTEPPEAYTGGEQKYQDSKFNQGFFLLI